jgi:serine/threonine protein kinase
MSNSDPSFSIHTADTELIVPVTDAVTDEMNVSSSAGPLAGVVASVTQTHPFSTQAPTEGIEAGTLAVGTQLAHYIIKGYIGGGGMGRVYFATDTALDRNVAIKILPKQRANDQGTVARFMNEARSAARLNHEHIAQVYFAGEQTGIPFIAFEYVEGTNVRALVENYDAFPLPQALNYLLQIAHALAHAAEHGVVHRDVKPSNILITKEGRAKLIDMGLARLLDPSHSHDDLTASGVTLGTFDYISPEQARDPRNADIRSDIYSLGCTFFFMLTGRPPFPEGTVLQKLLQHQGDLPPDIRSFQPSVPAEIAMLIQKMMAKDPKQRFQTPAVLIEALINAAKVIGLRPAGPNQLTWIKAVSARTMFIRRHLPWITAVGLLFAGFFLMTLYTEQLGTLEVPDLRFDNVEPVLAQNDETTETKLKESAKTGETKFSVSYRVAAYIPPKKNSTGLSLSRLSGGLRPAFSPKNKNGKHLEAGLSVLKLPPLTADSRTNTASSELVRCVDPSGETAGSFRTFSDALTNVEKGTVIELKWNGIYRIIEPLMMTGLQLTVTAAADYHPILLFEPMTSMFVSQSPRSLFTVTSCNLEFRDVAVEMRINQNVLAQHWSLFELASDSSVRFYRCCLTIRNKASSDDLAYHDDVAFFRNNVVLPVADPEAISVISSIVSESVPSSTSTERLQIVVSNSLLRGEATALQCDFPQNIDFQTENSIIALAKPFVQMEDTKRITQQETAVRVSMSGSIFAGQQWFVRQDRNPQNTEPMRLSIDAKNSIFILNYSPFAVFRGAKSVENAADYFHWSGTSNYFQKVTQGWRFRPMFTTSESTAPPDLPLRDWQEKMEPDIRLRTKLDTLIIDDIRKPMSRILAKDFVFSNLDDPALPPMLDWFPKNWMNE